MQGIASGRAGIFALPPAPHLGDDQPPLAGEAVGQGLEVARVAGQAVEAQQRRPARLAARVIPVMQHEAVIGLPLAPEEGGRIISHVRLVPRSIGPH